MNYLLTGATGFIGARLLHQLIARGGSVHYLGRRRNPNFPAGAVFHPWPNLLQEPRLDNLPPCETVIHLAGETIVQRWTADARRRIHSSRVEGTRHLVSALGKLPKPPEAFISASAVGYYGDRGNEILAESTPAGTGFLSRVCADWEAAAVQARSFGMRAVPIRISTVLGKEGGAFPLMARPFRFGLGATFGDGHQWMSWIHVQDLVALFLFAAANPRLNSALNGTSPEPVTNAGFTRALAQALHRPAFLKAPRFALRALLGEMSSFLFDSLRVIPVTAPNAGFSYRYGTLSSALADLVQH